jgi:DNA-binding transcriptional LysR family regulator
MHQTGKIMTLVQLKHFLELASSSSFSKSANKLHLTQPALSRSIKSLEEELGQLLFDRVGRKNEITAFGRHILLQAQDLVDGANNLKLSGQQLQSGQTGRVRLGLGSGPGALLMTPLLKHSASEYPKACLDIARGSTSSLVQALRDRKLDALVLDIRSLNPSSDLVVENLCEMPGAFLCRKGHPLAKTRHVTLDMVKAYPVASTPLSDEVARILVDRYGPDGHPDVVVSLRCEEVSSLLDVARSTNTIVIAVRSLAPDLVALKMNPELSATAKFGWVSLRSRSISPLCSRLHNATIHILDSVRANV